MLAAAALRGSWSVGLLVWLAGAAGVAVWVAVDRLGDVAAQGLERSVGDGGLPAVVLSGELGDGLELRRAAAAIVPVRAMLRRQLLHAEVQCGERRAEVGLLGAELAKEVLARPWRLGGAAAAAGDDAVYLDEATAAALHAAPGQSLQLRAKGGEARTLRLAATFASAGAAVAAVELTTAQQLCGSDRITSAELLLAPDQDPAAAAAALGAGLAAGLGSSSGTGLSSGAVSGLGSGVRCRVPPARLRATATVAALRTTWRLAGALALVFAALAIGAGIGEQLRGSRRDLQLLRSLGAAPWLCAGVAALPAAALGLGAAAFGALLGPALARLLQPGFAAWLQLQTGVDMALQAAPPRPWALAALLLGASVASALAALWLERRQRDGGEVIASAAASSPPRLLAAAGALAVVVALSLSGALRLGALVRGLDLALGMTAIALAAPPLAALVAGLGRGVVAELARARLRQRPDSLLGAGRLLAAALAITMALGAVGASLRQAVPAVVDRALPAPLVVTTLPDLLGCGAGDLDTARLRQVPGVAGCAAGRAPGSFDVWIDDQASAETVAAAVRARLPAFTVVLGAAAQRQRLRGSAAMAIDALDTMTMLLLSTALLGVAAFLRIDHRRNGGHAALLHSLGAAPRQRRTLALQLGGCLGAGAGVAGAVGGVLLGHVWTRGPLRDLLGWDCAFAVPWLPGLAILLAAPLLTAAMAALAGAGLRGARALTAW